MGGGVLTERFGRRLVLPLATALIGIGLVGLATVPTWELFLAATIPFGLGGGAIDGGVNGLVLDLYPTSRGRALNLLHLFFSLGALASPLTVGRLLEAGVGWQAIILGTAVVTVPLTILLALTAMPSGRHARAPATDGARRVGLALPLVLLAVAIAAYVGSEVGVSNWLVRFLESATRSAWRRPRSRCSGAAWRSGASSARGWATGSITRGSPRHRRWRRRPRSWPPCSSRPCRPRSSCSASSASRTGRSSR